MKKPAEVMSFSGLFLWPAFMSMLMASSLASQLPHFDRVAWRLRDPCGSWLASEER
jgi:hypothetical protein